MEEYLIREATAADVAEITHLANRYVYEKLSATDRIAGFLTGKFTPPAILSMVNSASSLVAVYQQTIVGFVINSKLPNEAYPPLLQTMIQKFPELYYHHLPLTAYTYFFYGPVLVSASHRGKGLLPRMFRQTQKLLSDKYDVGIAFIHAQNQNSLNIHTKKLGMDVVGQFSFVGNNYHILVFPVRA